MQEHIKKMAVEADPEFGNPDGDMPDAIVGMDAITRFAQAVARECVGICMARAARPMPVDEGWTHSEWDAIQGASEIDADAISARFGLDG